MTKCTVLFSERFEILYRSILLIRFEMWKEEKIRASFTQLLKVSETWFAHIGTIFEDVYFDDEWPS